MPTTKYAWDEDNVLYETDGADVVTAEYTNSAQQYGDLISEYRSATTFTHYTDAQGSTVALTNESGITTDTFLYNAWGEEVARTGTTGTPFRWIGSLGYYWDSERQLFYVRRRPFSAPLGRWLTMDPLEFADGMDLYVYIANNPVNRFDPSGMKKCAPPPADLLKCLKDALPDKWVDKDDRLTLATVVCVACQESDYKPCRTSNAGAIGIMQITPGGGWKQCKGNSAVSGVPNDGGIDKDCCTAKCDKPDDCDCGGNAWDPGTNIKCGIYYLKWCRDHVKPFVSIDNMLACYNMGPGAFTVNNGAVVANPWPAETSDYVKSVKECIKNLKLPK